MKTNRAKLKKKYGLRAIVLSWLISASFIAYQSLGLYRLSEKIEELCFNVSELQGELVFPEPFRALHVDKFQRTAIQLVSLSEQLKNNNDPLLLTPDTANLLYQTDRFLELSNHYISVEYQVRELTNLVKENREQPGLSDSAKQYYFQLGASVFEVMFTERADNPDTYLVFDELYESAMTLDTSERDDFLNTLSGVSNLLTNHAQMTFHIDQLLHHEVNNEQLSIMKRISFLMMSYMVAALIIASLLLASLTSWVRVRFSQLGQFIASETAVEEALPQPQLDKSSNLAVNDDVIESEDDITRLDLSVMHESMSGDLDAVSSLLHVFVEDHGQDPEAIRQLSNKEQPVAQRHVHSLKSVAASLGAEKMRQIAASTEVKFKNEEIVSLVELNLLATELEWVLSEVKLYLESLNTPN